MNSIIHLLSIIFQLILIEYHKLIIILVNSKTESKLLATIHHVLVAAAINFLNKLKLEQATKKLKKIKTQMHLN